MRVAALYDIHANAPALEAVLADVRAIGVDSVVVGGDVVPGPMPGEALDRLFDLDVPVRFLYGNGELAVLAQMDAPDPGAVTYWGTASGAPLPEPFQEVLRWNARQLTDRAQRLRGWEKTITISFPGLGRVLFCHATPRSETEIFTARTPDDSLRPMFAGVIANVVICGHTHMQFDRRIAGLRVVNAGSVGMPFGEPGAYWALIGPEVELRRTSYDLALAAERVRQTAYPQATEFAAGNILRPPSADAMLDAFERAR
jgi:predicted phosphodiesterase